MVPWNSPAFQRSAHRGAGETPLAGVSTAGARRDSPGSCPREASGEAHSHAAKLAGGEYWRTRMVVRPNIDSP
jgi:hypothetical protein